MNTDLELYRVFCEVVKYKNISKTAESMYISQSAITQSIQKLENLLGGKVFYRNKNGVELTEEGKSLYEYIKDSIEKINNAENLFSKYNDLEKGKIRIGGSNFLLTSLIFEPFIKFIKLFLSSIIFIIENIDSQSLLWFCSKKFQIQEYSSKLFSGIIKNAISPVFWANSKLNLFAKS